VVFAGVVQTEGVVVIPEGKGVKLIGAAAYTVNDTDAALVLKGVDSVRGDGVIVKTLGAVVGPTGVTGVTEPFATVGEGGTITGTSAWLLGDYTIGDGTSSTIAATGLTSKTLNVVGNLTVNADVTAVGIAVFGDITFGTGTIAVTTAAVTATGKLKAATGNTGITLPNVAHVFSGIDGLTTSTITTGTTGIAVNGTVNNGSFADGAKITGKVTFTGTTAFAGTLANTAESTYTFDGETTITGVLTVGTDGLTIAGEGAVSLTAKPVVAANLLLTVSNTGGVTLVEGIEVGVAGGLTVTDDGKVILADTKAITITGNGTVLFGSTAEVKLSGVGVWTATKAITIAGEGTSGIKITGSESGAKLVSSGTAPKLTLATETALDIGGTITLALDGTANGIAFTDETSTIVLNAGATITGTAATALEAKSGTVDGSGIKLTATDGTNSKITFTTAGVVTASASNPVSDDAFVLGLSEWTSGTTDNSAGVNSTVATAAIGSLSAGEGTTVTLAGASA
jgi:hypothetical protein